MHNSRYKDLKVWNKSVDYCVDIYKITENFPKHELYGLTDQMRRCSVSIPSNIAEGSGRGSYKDYTHFLYNSRGSAFELDTQIEIAKRLNYISQEDGNELTSNLEEITKMLNSLIKFNKTKY